jgi:hypothetical protein
MVISRRPACELPRRRATVAFGAAAATLVVLSACQPPEAPERSTAATVNAAVPDFRASTPRVDVTSAELVVGQARGGSFQMYGRAAVPTAQFGQRVSVPVTLACGTPTGCTVLARLRLLGDGGTPFDSADTESFALTGGDARDVGGFVLRDVRRLVASETLAVAPLNGTVTLTVRALDDADRPLARRLFTWASRDAAVATVDSLGRVTGLRPGRTTIEATIGVARAAVPVVVNAVQAFTLTASATRVIATLPVRLTPTLTVGPGVSARVRYRSSDTAIAVVSDNGTVQTRTAGVVVLTAIAEADTLQRRTVSLTVDPFRAAVGYASASVLSRGDVPANLIGLWGERFDNLVGVGCGVFARWNGSSWRVEQTPGYCSLGAAGTSENNVVAVGTQIWRWNGTAWARETVAFTGELQSVAAVQGVLYAVGQSGQILRRTEAGWSSMVSPTTRTLRGVHGITSGSIWAVGDGGVMLRYDGSAWQVMHAPDGQFFDCRTVHVRGPSDVLASCNERGWGWSIQRWDGAVWRRMETPQREFITDITESNGRMWAVGSQRTIYRQEGEAWVQDAERLGDVNIQAIYADGQGTLAVGNEGLSMRRTAAGWTTLSGYPLYDAMWAGAPDLIVAAGTRGAIDLFDGVRWTSSRPIGEQHSIRTVWGAARDAIFAGGPFATMLRYDGTQWQPMPVPTTAWIHGIWGVSRDSVWAVTSNGEILFYNGSQWTLTFRTGRQLLDIHGRDARHIVAVGDEGRVWRYDGRSWQREESNTDAQLRAVYLGPTRTFAVAGSQLFEHRDGEWQAPVTVAGSNFLWVTGTGDADVYAGGCGAQTRRFDGTTWTPEVPTNFSQCTFSGAVMPGGGLVIGGAQRDIISGTGPAGNKPGRAP